MERSPNRAPLVGYVKSGISSRGVIFTLAETGSSWSLSAKDLWLVRFSSFVDLDALSTPSTHYIQL